ncbi:MAG: type II secretion system F family protein [Planctomycetaceae bacterium]|jgi:type II secretory pathway component PulF
MGALFSWILTLMQSLFFERWGLAQALAVVRALQASVERQVPASPVLEALADELARGRQRELQRLSGELLAGVPVPEALDACPGLLPEEVLACLRAGYAAGQPAEAYREAIAYLLRQADETPRIRGGIVVYFTALLLLGTGILTFLMIWIVPKFKAILAGFDLELPAITKAFLAICDGTARIWYLLLAPLVAVIVLLLMAGGAVSEFLRQGTFRSSRSWLASLFPRINAPRLLRCVGLGVDAGLPLPEALHNLARDSHDLRFARQVSAVADRVEQGEDFPSVLLTSRFITPRESHLLEAATGAGNLGWCLRQTAVALERRSAARLRTLLELARPLAFLVAGCVVGFVVVALFQPLILMIDRLS